MIQNLHCCSHRRAEILCGHQLVSANSFGENCLVSYVSLGQACLNIHRYALPPTQGSHRQPSLQTPLFQSTENQMFLWHLLGTAYQGQKPFRSWLASPPWRSQGAASCFLWSYMLCYWKRQLRPPCTNNKNAHASLQWNLQSSLHPNEVIMLQTDPSTDKWDTYLPSPLLHDIARKNKRWGMEFVLPSLWRRRINPCQRNHFKKLKGSWASKSSARCNATIRADICKYNQM